MNYYLKNSLLAIVLACGISVIQSAQDAARIVPDLLEEEKKVDTGTKEEAKALSDEILDGAVKTESLKSVDFVELSDSPVLEMPQNWQKRPDVFDVQTDLLSLLRKSKIKGSIYTVNRTDSPIRLMMTRRGAADEGDSAPVSLSLEIASHRYKMLDFRSVDSIESLTVDQGFLNVVAEENRLFLTIEPKQALLFPRPLASFAFIPDLVALEKIKKEVSEYEAKKIKEYVDHIGYLRWATARDEWIGDKKVEFQSDPIYRPLYQKRHDLYEAIRIEKLLNAPLPDAPRIQQNLFSIWLTNQSKPMEPSEEAIDLILGSAALNPKKDGWTQYLVVQDFVLQDPELFKETRKKLADSGVELTSYEKLIGKLELQDAFDSIISKRKFAKASDLLRVELLLKLGGAYLDIDLVVLHSLKPLFYLYDSMFGMEPMSEFVCNAFMAASAGHPIMRESLDLMTRNFKLKAEGKTSFYSASVVDENDGFDTILQTGPCVTTVAIHNKSGLDGRRDLLAPSEMFYPAVTFNRPEGRIPNIDDAVGLGSATLHLWRTTWAGEKGKKNGCNG